MESPITSTMPVVTAFVHRGEAARAARYHFHARLNGVSFELCLLEGLENAILDVGVCCVEQTFDTVPPHWFVDVDVEGACLTILFMLGLLGISKRAANDV
jgi:hypothetical protein